MPVDPPKFSLEAISDRTINRELLDELVRTRMPYGRFKGRYLLDLPEPYVVWFKTHGFPDGKIGQQLRALYEIKLYGLEAMLKPLLPEDK